MSDGPFGIDHGYPSLARKYGQIGKSMVGQFASLGQASAKAARTPRKAKLVAMESRGKAAAAQARGLSGTTEKTDFASYPSRLTPGKRKAWERGFGS